MIYERHIEEPLVPFTPYTGDNFIFMNDDTQPHVVRIVKQYLQRAKIRTMVWPSKTPSFDPIKHIWEIRVR